MIPLPTLVPTSVLLSLLRALPSGLARLERSEFSRTINVWETLTVGYPLFDF